MVPGIATPSETRFDTQTLTYFSHLCFSECNHSLSVTFLMVLASFVRIACLSTLNRKPTCPTALTNGSDICVGLGLLRFANDRMQSRKPFVRRPLPPPHSIPWPRPLLPTARMEIGQTVCASGCQAKHFCTSTSSVMCYVDQNLH